MNLRNLLPRLLVISAGAVLVAVAVFASRLGIDHNAQWGASRRWLFAIGWIALVAGLWPFLRRLWNRVRRASERPLHLAVQKTEASLASSPAGAWSLHVVKALLSMARHALATLGSWINASSSPDETSVSRLRLAATLTGLAVIGVQIAYVFIVSVGTWTDWPRESEYYSLLSHAFRAGQVYLPVQPDPALVALDNPYDLASRGDIPVLWDSSYYEGKYYLYYGPTPGLLLAGAEAVTGKVIGDQYLVFAFVSLINLSMAWMLFYLWRTLFRATSPWLLALLVASAGLASPLPWLLGRPAFYEAAIAGGEAFLLLGLTFALPEWVEGRCSPTRLAVAGLSWALAAGSRAALLPALLIPAAWLVIRLLRSRPVRWGSLAAFLLPFIAGGLALAWYNQIRFGNILETGFRYVLTTFDQIAGAHQMFMLDYLPSNLFNYLWMPMRQLSVFPFVKAQWGIASVPILGFHPGGLYQTEQISGIMRTTPLAWLVFVPAGMLVLKSVRRNGAAFSRDLGVSLMFGGVAFGGFASLVTFHWAAMRFAASFAPQLSLMAVVGSWMAIESLRSRPGWRMVAGLALAALAIRGLALGLLLGITSQAARFESLNPELFDALTRFFAL